MEKILFWKVQTVNNSEELEVGSQEFGLYREHYLKDFKTREEMSEIETVEHYKNNAWKNPIYGKLYSLTLAFVKDNVIRIKYFSGEEKDLLINFINTVKSTAFQDYSLACFESEYLLPYLGVRMDKNNILEVLPEGLEYRNRRPWNLTSISIRDYYKGAGSYAPSLKELGYIFNLPTEFLGKEEVSKGGEGMKETAISEIKTLVNVFRGINKLKPLEEVVVSEEFVENKVIEEPKTILHELYDTKMFDNDFKSRLKTQLVKRKVLKRDLDVIETLLKSAYLDKIEVTDFNKKEKVLVNEEREKEIKEFIKQFR